jgi:hypothetical protein
MGCSVSLASLLRLRISHIPRKMERKSHTASDGMDAEGTQYLERLK